jgi:ABC-type branched-subunit amino acid transport system substrate-binding protein
VTIRLGALGPLSRPGIPAAGEELRAAMQVAMEHVNALGTLGAPLELRFEDTAGSPARGREAVEQLVADGVCAILGEFHSVVADAIVEPIDRAGVPFICASATMDTITARRLPYVFRVAPAQSYGWRAYADFLGKETFGHVVSLTDEQNVYWARGAGTVETRLSELGVRCTRVNLAGRSPRRVAEEIVALSEPSPDIVLLLVSHPQPLGSLLRELRIKSSGRSHMRLGDPAGRVIFPDWWDVAGETAAHMPFLAYARPDRLTPEGQELRSRFRARYGREPTFVALEGCDTVLALAGAIHAAGATRPSEICAALRVTEVRGTRAAFRFSTEEQGLVHQQWRWPPVFVVTRPRRDASPTEVKLLWDASNGP